MALVVKNIPTSSGGKGDADLIPGSARHPGGGHGKPLMYSCLENPMDRGALWATDHTVANSQRWLKQLNAAATANSLQYIICTLHLFMSDSLRPHGLQPARLLCSWISPGKNTGVGGNFLLQEIFLTQESNLGCPHCRQILYWLSYKLEAELII